VSEEKVPRNGFEESIGFPAWAGVDEETSRFDDLRRVVEEGSARASNAFRDQYVTKGLILREKAAIRSYLLGKIRITPLTMSKGNVPFEIKGSE